MNCPVHGPTVVAFPWARHGAGHTRDFDDTIAWLAVRCSKTTVVELMRIAWRTVGSVLTRVQADLDAGADRAAAITHVVFRSFAPHEPVGQRGTAVSAGPG